MLQLKKQNSGRLISGRRVCWILKLVVTWEVEKRRLLKHEIELPALINSSVPREGRRGKGFWNKHKIGFRIRFRKFSRKDAFGDSGSFRERFLRSAMRYELQITCQPDTLDYLGVAIAAGVPESEERHFSA
jgi:hypothetical protein